MSVQSEITRISGNVTAALAAIADKGVTVPDGSTSDALAGLIASIEAGGYLPTLPDGYALECGIYIPATDITSTIGIDLENKYIWFKSDRTGNTYCLISSLDSMKDVASIISGFNFATYDNKSDNRTYCNDGKNTLFKTAGITSIGFSTNSSSNLLRITGTSVYPLKAGARYLWIVVGEVLS